jgi:hypothetical protein
MDGDLSGRCEPSETAAEFVDDVQDLGQNAAQLLVTRVTRLAQCGN